MADVSDVNNALVALIAQTLYPNGTSNPVSPITNCQIKIFAGWPSSAQLDADLAAGNIQVSVFSGAVPEENTTRYTTDFKTLTPAAITLTATVDGTGTRATIGGTVSTPQNVALLVNGLPFVYAVQASDTLTSIAAGLATLVNAMVPATSSGPVVTIAGAHSLIARVGGVGTSIQEISRQKRQFQISFWCPSPVLRDLAVPPVDVAFKARRFLTLVDGSAGRLIYEKTIFDDAPQKELLYRRDLFYWVDYGTTQTETDTAIVTIQETLKGGLSATGTVDPNGPAITTINL
jgi:hypothetical protein